MVKSVSALNQSLHISAAGMSVQAKRLQIISQNLANVQSRDEQGNPYQRQTISFINQKDPQSGLETVQVKSISKDQAPFKQIYDPGNQLADENGLVSMPNINSMSEMMDMREAGLTHEANLKAYERTLKMIEETINLLRH